MNYKHLLRICLASLLTLAPSAYAGQTIAEVQRILFYDGGNLIYVYPKGGVNNPPNCHTIGGGGDYYSFSASRPMAKEYLSGLLSAQSRKSTVTLWGKGDCVDQSTAETLDYFRIEN